MFCMMQRMSKKLARRIILLFLSVVVSVFRVHSRMKERAIVEVLCVLQDANTWSC